MKRNTIHQIGEYEWHIPTTDGMRVPGIIYASQRLIREMDELAIKQVRDVACLPGIVKASMAMPDAHSGYGFPIGGVAAFDPGKGGIISMGGVGFDISCGVRTMLTGLTREDILSKQELLAEALFQAIPAGVGRGGDLHVDDEEIDEMLYRGAAWAVDRGFGTFDDLLRIEEGGIMRGASAKNVSGRAKDRIRNQVGSLGSGNHYLEIQWVDKIIDKEKADIFDLREGEAVVSIHCGSRGLGHQIGQDFLDELAPQSKKKKNRGKRRNSGRDSFTSMVPIANRELACAPIHSEPGKRYIGAMQAGINCALANRQVIGHLVRQVFNGLFPNARLSLLYDVSHNTCKAEPHELDGKNKTLFVHRKGATRALGPGHPDIPAALREAGQPVLVGGSMGTPSYILAGTREAEEKSFSSTCHGAGRTMSRNEAKRLHNGRDVSDTLRHQGIYVRSFSTKSIAEEAPAAYKNIDEVVTSAAGAGLVVPVARVMPLVCVKG